MRDYLENKNTIGTIISIMIGISLLLLAIVLAYVVTILYYGIDYAMNSVWTLTVHIV